MAMNNKGTNAYTIRNFRRVKKNAYTRIACVHFASALFAYLRAALYGEVIHGVSVFHFAVLWFSNALEFYRNDTS